MRFDRPDSADDHVGMAGGAQPLDKPDATGKDFQREENGKDRPGPPTVLRDAASRVEEHLAYRARVEAVYQPAGTDSGRETSKEPERETATFAMGHTEVQGRDRGPASAGSHSTGRMHHAEASGDSDPLAGDGSTPSGNSETRVAPAASENGGRDSREAPAPDAALGDDEGPYCPLSELKADEPATAERLLKAPDFTGENLRGFKDTCNPDFIDKYNRTYDAVAGPAAWASPQLNLDRMIGQIQRHMYLKEGVDFTVLDLTGASETQIDEVFKNLDNWESNPEMRAKSRLIILGGSY